MPADRFIHPKLGHSQKVSKLKDFEFRVWVHYILSADDFGVMRATAAKLRADSDALDSRSAKTIEHALEVIVSCGLVRVFHHQERAYVYQLDWQDFQKVTYPAKTINPAPTGDDLEKCSEATKALFSIHPGAKKLSKNFRTTTEVVQEFSRSSPEELPSRGKRLTANGDGSRLMANGSEGGPGETAKQIGPRDVWWGELLRRYPANRTRQSILVQQQFNDAFARDPRPDGEVWADILDGLENALDGYEWRVKGMAPALDKWLARKGWTERHEHAPVSTVISEKTARNLTAMEQFIKAGDR